jgi:hypothetical protein
LYFWSVFGDDMIGFDLSFVDGDASGGIEFDL